MQERVAQAMRPKPPKKMKKSLIEKVPGIWSRLSYSNKIILRNIFLNKQKHSRAPLALWSVRFC